MKFLRVIGLIILAFIAIKLAFLLVGLAGTLLFLLFWGAIFYVAGLFIWRWIDGNKQPLQLSDAPYLPQLTAHAHSIKKHLVELKRQIRTQ
jgi:hypothetical protein